MTETQAIQLISDVNEISQQISVVINLQTSVICGLGFIGAMLFGAMLLKILREKQF